MKKLGIIAGIIVVLFALIIIITKISDNQKVADNPYGKDNLKPATIKLLDNKNYQNIILPKELEKKIEKGGPVYAYMFSSECPHCMNFTPTLMEKAEELDVQIDQYNLLEFKQGWDDYEIEATPTLIYFNEGKEVNRIVGDYTGYDDELTSFLSQAKE